MAKIAPSILSADFSRLGEEVKEVCGYGIDYLHIDVMDGAFVPNISFGPGVMKSIISDASVPFDVHLMIEDPDRYINEFVTEKTEFITVHQEACRHLNRTVSMIKDAGIKAGVSINPATPVHMLDNILEYTDLVLLMSVNPGFGGQKFIGNTIDKIKELKKIRDKKGLSFEIEIDGGVNISNADMIKEAGADILVAGSAVFKADNRKKAIEMIRGL